MPRAALRRTPCAHHVRTARSVAPSARSWSYVTTPWCVRRPPRRGRKRALLPPGVAVRGKQWCEPRVVTVARRRQPPIVRRLRSGGSEGLDDQGVARAAATAERGGAGPATTALELVEQRQGDAGARHADRVAERDRAAVDVGDLVGDAEVLHRR